MFDMRTSNLRVLSTVSSASEEWKVGIRVSGLFWRLLPRSLLVFRDVRGMDNWYSMVFGSFSEIKTRFPVCVGLFLILHNDNVNKAIITKR